MLQTLDGRGDANETRWNVTADLSGTDNNYKICDKTVNMANRIWMSQDWRKALRRTQSEWNELN